jgi:hypothetical protein
MSIGLGFNELLDCVIEGLKEHHPEVTEQDALNLLDQVAYKDASLAVSKAVAGFFGSRKEKDTRPTKKALGGTGAD